MPSRLPSHPRPPALSLGQNRLAVPNFTRARQQNPFHTRANHYNHADTDEQDRIRLPGLFVGNYLPRLEGILTTRNTVIGALTLSVRPQQIVTI
jgi:hypothetical protein